MKGERLKQQRKRENGRVAKITENGREKERER